MSLIWLFSFVLLYSFCLTNNTFIYCHDRKHVANMLTAVVNSKHSSGSGCTPKAKDSAQCEAFDWEGDPSIDGLLK